MSVVTKWFSQHELACPCGCGFEPAQDWVDTLNKIREDFGFPIEISSKGGVARCITYNSKIGGARYSMHKRGRAADLIRTELLLKFLLEHADTYNIWIEDPKVTTMWIHIDNKYRPTGRTFIP